MKLRYALAAGTIVLGACSTASANTADTTGSSPPVSVFDPVTPTFTIDPNPPVTEPPIPFANYPADMQARMIEACAIIDTTGVEFPMLITRFYAQYNGYCD